MFSDRYVAPVPPAVFGPPGVGIGSRRDPAERRDVRGVDVRLAVLVAGLLIEIAALLHQAPRVGRRGRQRHLLAGGFRIQHHELPHARRPHGHRDIAAELRLRDLDDLFDRAAVLRDVDAIDLLDVVVGLLLRRLDEHGADTPARTPAPAPIAAPIGPPSEPICEPSGKPASAPPRPASIVPPTPWRWTPLMPSISPAMPAAGLEATPATVPQRPTDSGCGGPDAGPMMIRPSCRRRFSDSEHLRKAAGLEAVPRDPAHPFAGAWKQQSPAG